MSTRGTCLSDLTIAAFLERRLSDAERAEVEDHLDGCASCRRVVIESVSAWPLPSSVAEAHTTYPARPCGKTALAKGSVVGRFVVLDLLGTGGMGVVYTAYDPELDRKVALKLLHPPREGEGDEPKLLAEAQVMARINHANVIAVYEVGTHRNQVFAAMELIEGTTLRRWMTEQTRSWRQIVDVFVLAGDGLAAAHTAGVVHRDFKPENVLLGDDGRVKVSDFGLATASPAARGAHIAGTPGYVSVEQLEGLGADERSDQFSFCIALHEALHGSRPFSARSLDDLVTEVRRGPDLEGARRTVPPWLNRVVRRGLALAPEERYPSMRALTADIRRTIAVRRTRPRVAAAVATLALVTGALALAMDRRTGTTRPSCADAADRLTGVWDSARRDAVRSAFLGTASPSAAAEYARAADLIDRYAAAWTTIRTEICEASDSRRESSAPLHDLRMACLDRARIQLRALSDVLVAADLDTVREAAAAAAALPPLDACSDADALRAIVSPPLGGAARARLVASPSPSDDASAPVDRAEVAGQKVSPRPDFRLPFGCGETWQLTYRHDDEQVDFDLPGDRPSAGFAVLASAPGWVSDVISDNGEVDIHHGGGWFTTYQHMTDISVSPHQYVGGAHVIGRVGHVNVRNPLGGPGRAHLRYEQVHLPGAAGADFQRGRESARLRPHLEGELAPPGSERRVRTSTNSCAGGGTPGGAVQYDLPTSTRLFSPSQATMEILTRRSGDQALFERWYGGTWNGASLPYTIAGQPSVIVFKGDLHVLARRSSGTLFDLRYSPFAGWQATALEGAAAGDPDTTVFGWSDSLHVAARGVDGYLYHWWTVSNGSWTKAVRVGKLPVSGTPALFAHYDTLYIVARASDDSLWSWEWDRRGQWKEWQLRGAAGDSPDVGVDPQTGLVNVVARGVDNRLHRWQARDPDTVESRRNDGWSDPELVDADHVITGAPAAAIYRGALHIVARSSNNELVHWWKDAVWHFEATGGTYTGDPDIVQFSDQLQTIGRGADGRLNTIWYDPMSGIWTQEYQGIIVSE